MMGYISAFTCSLLLYACHSSPPDHLTRGQTPADTLMPIPAGEDVYYDYGGPPELYFNKAQKAVLKRYGIQYKGFGCVITDSIVKVITQHNDSLFARLAAKFPGLNENTLQQVIEAYIATDKAIESVIAPYLKKKIRHCIDSPYYYPQISWQAIDTPAKNFYADIFLQENIHGDRMGPVLKMRVNPSTGDMLVRGTDGKWNECTK